MRDILDVATPSMRPLWVGRTKPMTRDETLVLVLALQAGERLQYRPVFDAVGEGAHGLLTTLKRQGALIHVRYDHWQITEKGRIAAALAMAKDPTLAEVFT